MILIPNDELKLLKRITDQELTGEEGEIILWHQKIFVKYLSKIITNIQIDLGLGKYREKETLAYNKIEAIYDLINGIEEIEKAFMEYNKKE